jgi:hypothetical protein
MTEKIEHREARVIEDGLITWAEGLSEKRPTDEDVRRALRMLEEKRKEPG